MERCMGGTFATHDPAALRSGRALEALFGVHRGGSNLPKDVCGSRVMNETASSPAHRRFVEVGNARPVFETTTRESRLFGDKIR